MASHNYDHSAREAAEGDHKEMTLHFTGNLCTFLFFWGGGRDIPIPVPIYLCSSVSWIHPHKGGLNSKKTAQPRTDYCCCGKLSVFCQSVIQAREERCVGMQYETHLLMSKPHETHWTLVPRQSGPVWQQLTFMHKSHQHPRKEAKTQKIPVANPMGITELCLETVPNYCYFYLLGCPDKSLLE